jgi:hypothetical protein
MDEGALLFLAVNPPQPLEHNIEEFVIDKVVAFDQLVKLLQNHTAQSWVNPGGCNKALQVRSVVKAALSLTSVFLE